MPITGNAYTDWVATTQSTSNEWQYFYLNNARTSATLLPSYQNGNEVVPNEPQWDNNEDGGISGDYPFIQRVTAPNTNVPSGTMRTAMGGTPNIVMHPSELNDRLPALTFKNTSGVTKLVSGTITLKLMNPVDTYDGIQYFFHRNLVNGSRYNLHSSGTILKNNTGTTTITFTDYELQANEHLYMAVESRANYIYDHVITNFSINVPSSYSAAASTASGLLVDPVVSAIKNVNYSHTASTASALLVDPVLSLNLNLDAFGVATASALLVDPVVMVVNNINYSPDPATCTALFVGGDVSITKAVNYSASPATASTLISSNFYGGNTTQDTSYEINLRQVNSTNNFAVAGGAIDSTWDSSGNHTFNNQMVIKAVSGVPAYNKIVKVKINPATTSYAQTNNGVGRVEVRVFTSNPNNGKTFDNMLTADLPTSELLYITRTGDDGTGTLATLDLTAAFADSRAATYGVYVKSYEYPDFTGTKPTNRYSTASWGSTGNHPEHDFLYILEADVITKNVNADIMTASALATDVTVATQKYVNVTADPSTASATTVTPTAGLSIGFNADPSTASALAVQPTFLRTVEFPHTFATAHSDIVNPTLILQGSKNYVAAPATAEALFHMPQANVGENNIVDHMNASALFVMPTLIIPESVDAMTTTASVTMVQPALNSQLLGAYKAQPMIASALYPNPPAYTNLFLDKWYSLLYNQHSIRHNFRTPNGGNGESILKLFDDVTSSKSIGSTLNNNLSYTIQSDGIIEDAGPAPAMSVVGEFSPSDNIPLISKGYYDNYERKAVKVNNISVGYENSEFINTGFSFELSIKTTKSDQIIAVGRTRSYYGSQANATALGLSDGKLFLTRTQTIGAAPVVHYKQTIPTIDKLIGNKRIDDGEWHHIVIQNGWNDGRIQFWIDGTLDRQISPGGRLDGISFIGFNSNISTYASNFETSVWSFDSHAFPREHEIDDHRFAYIRYEPVRAEPMLATATATQETAATANRSRMLLLYWWQNRVGYNQYVNDRRAGITTGVEGNNSPFRPEDLIDNATSAPLEWYGWDVFPVNVLEPKASDIIKQDNIENGKYVDRENAGVTRWLDLQKDLKLEQFDTIMFANYPTTSAQLDAYLGSEYVDDYFNVTEKVLYNDFLISLRKAIDSGMSLFIQFDQLARDLKIYDRVEVIPFFEDQISDKRAFWHTNNVRWDLENNRPDAYESRNPGAPEYLIFDEDKAIDRGYVDVDRGAYYYDWYNNARHRVVNTIEKLTDDASYVITDRAHYKHSEQVNFGSPDRWYERFEYKLQGLQPGDEFVFGDPNKIDEFGNTRSWRSGCYGIPFANIKAGKVITAQPEKYWRENVYTDNPYKNYAHSIALEPGDVLDGKGIGGKIFVSISEVFWDQTPEYRFLDLYYDYWINIAFNLGLITADQKNEILDSSEYVSSLNKTSEHYDWETYWSRSDNFAFTQIDKGQNLEGIIGLIFQETDLPIAPRSRKALADYSRNRDSLGRFASGAGGSGALFVKLTSGRTTNTMNIFTPNILTRGLWWLSDRLRPTGLVNRVEKMPVSVTMPGGRAVVDKNLSVLAPAMNSNAIFAANVSGTITITTQSVALPSLPLTASAMSPDLGTTIKANLFIANASMKEAGIFAFLLEEVILTVAHQDAVVYVKGDKIT